MPRPGAAKLNVNVDEEVGKNSGLITKALIDQAIAGNPTCLHLLIRWAEDAEFAEECLKVHGQSIRGWIAELETEMALPASEEGAETTAGAREPEI